MANIKPGDFVKVIVNNSLQRWLKTKNIDVDLFLSKSYKVKKYDDYDNSIVVLPNPEFNINIYEFVLFSGEYIKVGTQIMLFDI